MSLPNYALPLLAAILGNILYHLSSKAAPTGSSPFTILAVVYLFGFLGSAMMAFALEGPTAAKLGGLATKPAVVILALAVVLIEVGFIYAYRMGAPVSTSSLLVNATVAFALAGIGTILFREGVNAQMAVGMVVALIGVALVATAKAAHPL